MEGAVDDASSLVCRNWPATLTNRTGSTYFSAMRVSFATRLFGAGFALLAVWCLGCTSFDAFIGALLHGETLSATYATAGSATMSVSIGQSVASAASSDSSNGCGCGHCIAAQADPTEVAVVAQRPPETVQHRPGSATSVDRAPLVPPPIAFIAI